jgi:putative FmdB family regulatory protein
MPLYEYQCETCNEVFETIQKFSDEPLQEHANCGGKLRRLLSPAALQFKGTGWYVTDYGRKNGSSASHGSSKSEPANGTAAKSSDTAAKASDKQAKPTAGSDKK